jgi:hypothetical protein
MKGICLGLVLNICWVFGASSQEFGFGDVDIESAVVQTYDGSIYKGYVLGRTEFELQMLLPTMDTINVHEVLIHRMRSSNDYDLYKKGRFYPKKGFYGSLFFNSNYTGSGRGSNGLNAQLVYQPSKKYAYGLSGGFQANGLNLNGEWDWQTYTFWQFDLYGKYNLSRNSSRFYTDLKLGFGSAGENWREEETNGGLHIEPGFGLQFASKGHFRFNLGIAHQFQNSSGASNVWSPDGRGQNRVDYQLWYSRTVLRLGIEFY